MSLPLGDENTGFTTAGAGLGSTVSYWASVRSGLRSGGSPGSLPASRCPREGPPARSRFLDRFHVKTATDSATPAMEAAMITPISPPPPLPPLSMLEPCSEETVHSSDPGDKTDGKGGW